MHTCDPPIDVLKEWLTDYPTVNGRYGHLLLEQTGESDQVLVDALRPYVESAHLDARNYFHQEIGIDLHPDAEDEGAHAQYPACLPTKTRRGLFGELMAGLVTESYPFVGGHEWVVPVFLFRYHEDVKAYIFALARDPQRVRQVWGRFGSDFIGISLDGDGAVARIIVGEAKWRNTLTKSVVDRLLLGDLIDDPDNPGQRIHSGKGIWYEVNRDIPVPQGVRQLQRILEEYEADDYAAAILSIDRLLTLRDANPIPRTDLILIVGNAGARREECTTLIPWENAPPEYTAGNDLQIVEVYLTDGETLINELYDSLWTGEVPDASA
jgi:hypothetical protein